MPCQSEPIRQKKPRERNDQVTRQTAPTSRKKGNVVARCNRSGVRAQQRIALPPVCRYLSSLFGKIREELAGAKHHRSNKKQE